MSDPEKKDCERKEVCCCEAKTDIGDKMSRLENTLESMKNYFNFPSNSGTVCGVHPCDRAEILSKIRDVETDQTLLIINTLRADKAWNSSGSAKDRNIGLRFESNISEINDYNESSQSILETCEEVVLFIRNEFKNDTTDENISEERQKRVERLEENIKSLKEANLKERRIIEDILRGIKDSSSAANESFVRIPIEDAHTLTENLLLILKQIKNCTECNHLDESIHNLINIVQGAINQTSNLPKENLDTSEEALLQKLPVLSDTLLGSSSRTAAESDGQSEEQAKSDRSDDRLDGEKADDEQSDDQLDAGKSNHQLDAEKADEKSDDQLDAEKSEDQVEAEKSEDHVEAEKSDDQLDAEKSEDRVQAEELEDQVDAEKAAEQLDDAEKPDGNQPDSEKSDDRPEESAKESEVEATETEGIEVADEATMESSAVDVEKTGSNVEIPAQETIRVDSEETEDVGGDSSARVASSPKAPSGQNLVSGEFLVEPRSAATTIGDMSIDEVLFESADRSKSELAADHRTQRHPNKKTLLEIPDSLGKKMIMQLIHQTTKQDHYASRMLHFVAKQLYNIGGGDNNAKLCNRCTSELSRIHGQRV